MVVTTENNGLQIKQYNGKIVLHKIPNTLAGEVVIPQRVTHIQISSFAGCSGVTSIVLQDKVKEIKAGAFRHCTDLEKITVSRDNKHFESDRKGVLFTKGMDWLVCAPAKLSGIYVVPGGVKHIEKEAFKSCGNITTLMLAQTVQSIGKDAFRGCTGLLHMTIPLSVSLIAPGAFAGCSNLCGITVASDNPLFVSDRDGALFHKDKRVLLYVPATINGQEGKKDGRYVVPEGVTMIADRAFSGCTGIRELVLPDTLQSVSEDAFENCEGLEVVYAPAGFNSWQVFDECKGLQKRCIRDPLGLIYDRDKAKIDVVWKEIACANILNGIEKLEPKTFLNCKRLSKVVIPESVTEIGEYSFVGCKSLTEFTVSALNTEFFTDEYGVLLQRIGNNVVLMRAPTNLCGTYCIPDGVTHIAGGAFESCVGLTEIIAPSSIRAIAKFAFIDCTNLRRLALPVKFCAFTGRITEKCPNLTICAPANSTCETYAKQFNVLFREE